MRDETALVVDECPEDGGYRFLLPVLYDGGLGAYHRIKHPHIIAILHLETAHVLRFSGFLLLVIVLEHPVDDWHGNPFGREEV